MFKNHIQSIRGPWGSARLWGLGLIVMGGLQTGCAHPLVVEPSVVISSRIGHAPVHAQIGWPPPVVVMPPPRLIYTPPPRVVHAPPVYRPAPGLGPGHGRSGGRGHRHGHDRDHDAPGERRGWRR